MLPVKYRAACDQCAGNKIKCDQQRPQCQRCISLGRPCHYSKSMRAGKPPRARIDSANGQKRLSESRRISPAGSPPRPRMDSQDSLWRSDSSSWLSDEFVEPTSSISPLAGVVLTDPFAGLHHDLGFASSIGTGDPNQDPDRYPSDMDTSSTPVTPDELHRLCVGSLGARHQCHRIATETLSSLYDLSSMLETHPSADLVLSITAEAARKLDQVLACQCDRDFGLPMVVMAVAFKIIGWLQGVLDLSDPHIDGSDALSKEQVFDRSLTIGTFQLDDQTSWAVKHQVVLRQLKTLRDTLLRHRTCFSIADDGPARLSLSAGRRMYASMAEVMDRRLQHTIDEVEIRLQRC